jgi:hypothetical protein
MLWAACAGAVADVSKTKGISRAFPFVHWWTIGANMSQETKDKITAILAGANVAYHAANVGETVRSDNWQCDQWRITFLSGKVREQFDYFTGLAHRKLSKHDEMRRKAAGYLKPGTIAYESWEKAKKPVPPHAADVLYCLLSEAEACNMSFSDWCEEYGYSNDSLKALNTYRECEESGRKLQKLFTRETLEAMREALQDY